VPRHVSNDDEAGTGISGCLEEFDPARDTITTVDSIRYENPIEIVLGVGALAAWLLTIVRDWPGRRRLNKAIAADEENQVPARKELLDLIVRGQERATSPFPCPDHDLLTIDITKAMTALGDSRISLREPGSADDEA
jgi:hypothetical protein